MNVIDSIFSEFLVKRETIEMSLDQMKKELAVFGDNIILYGAGSAGIAFLHYLRKIGIQPLFFVDSNENKIGLLCEGVLVISPDEIVSKVNGEFIVIVCINTDGKRYCKSFDEALKFGGHHGVYDKLRKAGCRNIIDYTYFRRCFDLFKDERFNAPSCSDVDMMVSNKDAISAVYDYLQDDLSRETFEKIVRFRLLDDSITVPTLSQDNQYFERDLYRSVDDASFLDCGAYNGISLRAFLQAQNNVFSQYYGFEPDKDSFIKLQQTVNGFDEAIRHKIILSDAAVWDCAGNVGFYSLQGPGSFVSSEIGKDIVRTVSIDDYLGGNKVSFIKMNIEGSERSALKGAEKTISAYRPQLAIAGYHKTDDLWIIPLMIKSFRDDYRLILRSYMNHISFVYYTI